MAWEKKGKDEEDRDHEETMSGEFCFISCLILHGKKFAKEFSFHFYKED